MVMKKMGYGKERVLVSGRFLQVMVAMKLMGTPLGLLSAADCWVVGVVGFGL
jgi:hypothetical protein